MYFSSYLQVQEYHLKFYGFTVTYSEMNEFKYIVAYFFLNVLFIN